MHSIKSNSGLTRGRGISESTHTLWVTALHKCGEVEQAMRTVTKTTRESSEQHVELGRSRRHRDYNDLMKMCQWFDKNDPFDITDTRLRSLSSGLFASIGDGINCDDAENVGYALQKKLDLKTVDQVKMETTRKVKSLIKLSQGIKVDDQEIHIDPTVLFLRILLLIERSEDPTSYFDYELTPYPTSWDNNRFM